jgi:hypothetical protein
VPRERGWHADGDIENTGAWPWKVLASTSHPQGSQNSSRSGGMPGAGGPSQPLCAFGYYAIGAKATAAARLRAADRYVRILCGEDHLERARAWARRHAIDTGRSVRSA